MPSRIRIEENIAYIQMTQGFEAIIDADMVPVVSAFNWWPKKDKRSTYARTRENYKSETIYLHRLILGAPENLQVDHKNCNGLDNRKENLRLATHQQNMHNCRPQINNSSGFKGVKKHKGSGKWVASITLNNETIYLGIFPTAELASDAYVLASENLHGEFGRVI